MAEIHTQHEGADPDLLGRVLYKVKNCPNYETLYSMEEDFNRVGLTIQTTPKNRMVLCRIIENRPRAKRILEDYVFIGDAREKGVLEERTLECLTSFILNSASKPSKVMNCARAWQSGVRTYGQVILVNEDVKRIAQSIED